MLKTKNKNAAKAIRSDFRNSKQEKKDNHTIAIAYYVVALTLLFINSILLGKALALTGWIK